MNNVSVLTVTYGNRFHYLKKVVEAVIHDTHVYKVIIVDNNSQNGKEIDELNSLYPGKVEIVRHEHNLGSAGGFASGIVLARTHPVEHLLILDDDNVPQEGAIGIFLETLSTFPDKKVVLCGNRLNLPGNTEFFYRPPLQDVMPKGTFFDVLSFAKLQYFLQLVTTRKNSRPVRGQFIPITPNESFVYGGSFIPMSAVKESPLPDETLVLYGDDIEYSWNIKRRGYASYVCERPHIFDIDYSFTEGTHITGLFYASTKAFKVYYKIRNMVLLSVRHTKQGRLELLLNIVLWISALFLLGFMKTGYRMTYFKRVRLILIAVYAGYYPKSSIAKKTEGGFPEVGRK